MFNANVVLSEWVWRRKHIFYYLIVVDDFFDKNGINVNIGDEFERVTFGYAKAYIEKGEMPPAEIAPAILNMADDYMSGRPVTIRAGDYIAVHNHLRKGARPAK